MSTKIKTAVITGEHEYDVVSFQSLFRSIPEIDAYPQNMWDFVTDAGEGRKQYDVLLFYNMPKQTPGGQPGEYGALLKQAVEELGDGGPGIFVLHHALVAFPDWPLWGELCGVPQRANIGSAVDQRVHIEIADPDHPITTGLKPWDIIDETYITGDADGASKVLLTTDHPDSMSTIAWTRTYKSARVFCYQSGHDDVAFSNPSFRTVVARGVQWLAGRI